MTPARALLPALALYACATEIERLQAPRVVSGMDLVPFAVHEDCMALATAERIADQFTAQPPVAFNIHFHEGNAVILPIDIASTVDESDTFAADRTQGYCLMWEAGPQGSHLAYRVQPVAPRR